MEKPKRPRSPKSAGTSEKPKSQVRKVGGKKKSEKCQKKAKTKISEKCKKSRQVKNFSTSRISLRLSACGNQRLLAYLATPLHTYTLPTYLPTHPPAPPHPTPPRTTCVHIQTPRTHMHAHNVCREGLTLTHRVFKRNEYTLSVRTRTVQKHPEEFAHHAETVSLFDPN